MNAINEKIETFVVLRTVESLDLANRITAAFEDLGIPVLLEHLDVSTVSDGAVFRISTQLQYSENASRIVDNFMTAHDTRKVVTSRDSFNN